MKLTGTPSGATCLFCSMFADPSSQIALWQLPLRSQATDRYHIYIILGSKVRVLTGSRQNHFE